MIQANPRQEPPADRAFILGIQRREEDALRALIGRYAGYVGRVVAAVAKGALSAADVEEVASDVFLSLWNSAGRLDPERPLGPYLAKIARNQTCNCLRARRLPTVTLSEELLIAGGDVDELTALREQHKILNDTVARLGAADREIFLRFYFWGEKLSQISAATGVNLSTVKTKLRRSREKLKNALEERGYFCHEPTKHP